MQTERQTSSPPLHLPPLPGKALNQQQTVVPFWSLLCYSVSHLHFLIFLISVQQFLIRRSSGKSACFIGEDADSALSVRWELAQAGSVGVSLLPDKSPAGAEMPGTQQTGAQDKVELSLLPKYQNWNECLDHCYHASVLQSEWLFFLLATFKWLMFNEGMS